ncbi:hypothetical protein GCM10008935_26480 [Alkalibacillus silvisoli]|uniref:Phage portal protein n=1 Tax=Alkalibacillus silvisoli TaxID=392823 RepID=A0ABP3K1K6_9BACI
MKIPLITKIFQSRSNPKNSFLGNIYSFFFGSTISGKAVNERTAMQTTAVCACVRILAETIASLPQHVYKYTDNGKEKALKLHLYNMLHDEPNSEMISFVFRETLMSHLLLREMPMYKSSRIAEGMCFLFIPDKMTVNRTSTGEL